MTPADVVQCPSSGKRALDVAARLADVGPLHLPGVALLVRLHQEQVPASELLDLQPDLTKAMEALGDHLEAVKDVVRRCRELPPIPSRTLPPGF